MHTYTYVSRVEKNIHTPETRFSELRFSEILNLMNKLYLPFSYFTLYPNSNSLNRVLVVLLKLLTIN